MISSARRAVRVLMLDDEPDEHVERSIREQLQAKGAVVDLARTTAEALAAMGEGGSPLYPVCLADCRIQGASDEGEQGGVGFAQVVRDRFDRAVTIIGMTRYPDEYTQFLKQTHLFDAYHYKQDLDSAEAIDQLLEQIDQLSSAPAGSAVQQRVRTYHAYIYRVEHDSAYVRLRNTAEPTMQHARVFSLSFFRDQGVDTESPGLPIEIAVVKERTAAGMWEYKVLARALADPMDRAEYGVRPAISPDSFDIPGESE